MQQVKKAGPCDKLHAKHSSTAYSPEKQSKPYGTAGQQKQQVRHVISFYFYIALKSMLNCNAKEVMK